MCIRASCLEVFSMTTGKISKNAGLSSQDMRSTEQISYMADNKKVWVQCSLSIFKCFKATLD